MVAASIVFPDDVGIHSIGPMADALVNAIASGRAVRVDLSAVARPDLCLVQLISAARQEAGRIGADLSLAGPATPALAALLERAGILTASPEETAFWRCEGVSR